MPFVAPFFANGGATAMTKFYNVTDAVGAGTPNRKLDVMLVQYFLKRIYEHPEYAPAMPQGKMVVDGVCGPITKNWILKFQLDANEEFGGVALDRRVDRARGGAAGQKKGTISGTFYTVLFMNDAFNDRYPQEFNNPQAMKDAPAELRLALQSSTPV